MTTSVDPPQPFAAREPIFPRRVHGRFTRDDRTAPLTPTPSGYAAAPLAAGRWRVEIAATAADGTAFRQGHDILVRP